MRWIPDFNNWVLMLPPANAGALQIGEELAYWQRAKGAPGGAFVLDVKRAFLVAKKAGLREPHPRPRRCRWRWTRRLRKSELGPCQRPRW
ncbi:unnamed protein product [Pylaiella littoralis]